MEQKLTYIHPDAKIGKNVTIEPFSTIAADVEIGDNTWIGPNVTIMDGARIGENCKIFPGTVISAIPQDLKFVGEKTTVEIGNNTTIRECVTINRGTKAKGRTVVGNNCLLMCYVHVAHDCIIKDYCILTGYSGLAGEVVINEWAIIGGQTVVHQFVHIGAHAMVSGGSLVRKDVPPFIKAAREPLTFVGINTVGLKRRRFTTEKIDEIHEIYRYIFQKDMNNSEAIEYVKKNMQETPERDLIIDFVRQSERGIIKGFSTINSDI